MARFLDKGKCRIGLHAGEWAYVSAGACEQERVCPRCETRSLQVVHAWQDWAAPDAAACDLVRRCAHCGDEEAKVEHVWGVPSYAAEDSCEQVRPCTRCGVEEPAATVHRWDAWTYAYDDACEQVPACSRCGLQGSGSRVAHDWGTWETSAFYRARVCVCRHCAETVLNLDEQDDLEGAVSFQATHRALWAVIDATDVISVRERITADAELLLTPAGTRCLEFSIDQLATDDDERSTLRGLGELLDRCRVEGIDAVFADPPENAAEEVEPPAPELQPPSLTFYVELAELIGHWRSTESSGDSDFSSATDTNMDLGSDGRFQWWLVLASAASGESRSETKHGSWSWSRTEDVLSLAFDDGTELVRRIAWVGDWMTFAGDSHYGFWQRVEGRR